MNRGVVNRKIRCLQKQASVLIDRIIQAQEKLNKLRHSAGIHRTPAAEKAEDDAAWDVGIMRLELEELTRQIERLVLRIVRPDIFK